MSTDSGLFVGRSLYKLQKMSFSGGLEYIGKNYITVDETLLVNNQVTEEAE